MATIYKLNDYTDKRKEETNMNFTEFQELFDMEYTTKEEFKEMGIQFLDHEQIHWINIITKDIKNDLLSYKEVKDLFSLFDRFFDTHHTYYDMYTFIRDSYFYKAGISSITKIRIEESNKVTIDENLNYSVLEVERARQEAIKNIEALSVYEDVDNLECKSRDFLYYADSVLFSLINTGGINEFFYQDLFKEHYKSFLPLTELVERENNRHHIPDAWLKENDEYIPVEVKLNNFNASALRQLKRYMEFYDCKNGVAVGDKLTVELPDNIQFVSNKELTELEKQK